VRSALLVALGGSIGSVLRWWVSGAVQHTSGATFPWGTFAVNAAGSFAIGLVGAVALERALVSPAARLFVVAGVLGGFTTFSAFSYETLALLRDGQWAAAAGYALGSVATGVAAAFGGFALGARLG
jgi:CrcB protein